MQLCLHKRIQVFSRFFRQIAQTHALKIITRRGIFKGKCIAADKILKQINYAVPYLLLRYSINCDERIDLSISGTVVIYLIYEEFSESLEVSSYKT